MVARGFFRSLSPGRAEAGNRARAALVTFATFATLAFTLSGCAGMATLSSEVASYGNWPTGQAPGTYAFERLPSQQARAQEQDTLEAAARPALEAAGFKPAPAGSEPQVLAQVGARVTRTDRSPWDDPLWWRGSFGYWRYGPWPGPSWRLGMRMDSPRYDREVAVLLRDRTSGKPIYEARASNDGYSTGNTQLLAAMFAAALKDFPAVGLNPRTVVVPLAP
jgi:hypothetical protein